MYIRIISLTVMIILSLDSNALAGGQVVEARVDSIIDGERLKVEAHIWHELVWRGVIRIGGVETPKLWAPVPACEKELGRKAREFLKVKIEGKNVWLTNIKHRRGNVVAVVLVGGVDLGYILIESGHGRPYADVKTPRPWCE